LCSYGQCDYRFSSLNLYLLSALELFTKADRAEQLLHMLLHGLTLDSPFTSSGVFPLMGAWGSALVALLAYLMAYRHAKDLPAAHGYLLH